MIDADIAANPAKGYFTLFAATASQFPSAADAAQGGVKPEGHQNLRIDPAGSGTSFDRFERYCDRRKIEPFDKVPHDSRLIIPRQQIIPARRMKLNLLPLGHLQPRLPGPFRFTIIHHWFLLPTVEQLKLLS